MRKKRSLVLALLCFAILPGCDDGVPPQTTTQQSAPPAAPLRPTASRSESPPPVYRSMRFIEGYSTGVEAAAAQKKPMLLFFTATWCHYCRQLAAEAFTDTTVVGLSERFVCVLVDADREPAVCRYFQVPAYPTIQFVSARPASEPHGRQAAQPRSRPPDAGGPTTTCPCGNERVSRALESEAVANALGSRIH